MKISEILATIKLGEGLQTEFKESLSKNNERGVCKEIAAFATSQGGVILLGVTDSGVLVGVDDPALICEKIERWVSGRIKPAPLVEISKRTVRGKDVVVVHVTNGVAPFYQFDGIPYIRIGSSSLPMDPAQVVDVVRGRKIEDIIQSIEATLAATQASLSSTHSVAMVAMTAISPDIAGQGELATMSYQQIRERILHDLATSP